VFRAQADLAACYRESLREISSGLCESESDAEARCAVDSGGVCGVQAALRPVSPSGDCGGSHGGDFGEDGEDPNAEICGGLEDSASEGVADLDSAHRCLSPEPHAVGSEELAEAEDERPLEESVAASELGLCSSSASGAAPAVADDGYSDSGWVTESVFESKLRDGKRLRIS
jgi:hypothetical protein